jgi:hypothetical protein
MSESGTVVTLSGTLTETSSIRYKKNITNLQGSLDTVLKLQGVSYMLKSNDSREIGFIAEQVVEVLPDVIVTKDGEVDSIAYGRLTAILVEAIKEQQLQIKEQQLQINKLKSKYDKL